MSGSLYRIFIWTIVPWAAMICAETNMCSQKDIPGVIPDIRLLNTMFASYNSTGMVDWLRFCKRHKLCLSTNFHVSTSKCELNSNRTGIFVNALKFFFASSENTPDTVQGGCAHHNCSANQRCQSKDNSGYTCVTIGCFGPPGGMYVNQSSFANKILWGVNETVTYPCETGFYPSVNAQCLENGNWTAFDCLPFQKCQEIRLCGGSNNGEYWLNYFLTSERVKIFCSFQEVYQALPFITLIELNKSILSSDIRVSNNSCIPEVQQLPYNNPLMGETLFHKILLHPTEGYVIVNKFTYAVSNGSHQKFASAGDCFAINNECPVKGSFVLDLRGTGIRIVSTVHWITWGELSHKEVNKGSDGLQVSGRCGGYCGGCRRNHKIYVELDPSHTWLLENNVTTPSCPSLV